MTKCYGTALITGASSGIGETFARKLAARRYDLILVARREERLHTVAEALRERYGVAVEVLAADLADAGGIDTLEQRIAESGGLTMLVNNAGFGVPGMFLDVPLDRQMDMITVHITATMRLTHAALPGMIERGDGAIINVSSVAAFLPVPGSVNYSATKVYLVNFCRALQAELAGSGVRVQALCPGFTSTGFHQTPEYKTFGRPEVPRFMWMSTDAVVLESLRALRRDQTVCIPGLKYRLFVAVAGNRLIAPLLEAAVRRQRTP